MDIATQVLSNSPDWICWKNKSSEYLGGTKQFAHHAKSKYVEDIIGKTDNELPWARFADIYRKSDEMILSGAPCINLLEPIVLNSEASFTIQTLKKPLRDDKEQLNGIIIYIKIINSTNILNFIHSICRKDIKYYGLLIKDEYSIRNNFKNISVRESEVLFYLMRSLTAKEIALKFNISYRTVETIINSIKNKLSCDNKNQVIEKAFSLGYINIIPETLLQG